MPLPKGSIRAQAQPFLAKLAAEGLSANQALLRLREAGLGYRRTNFLADYRKAIGAEKQKNVAKYIRKDFYPTRAVITPTELNLRRKYHNYIRYDYKDLETLETRSKTFIIADDKPLTIRQIEQAAYDLVSEMADTYRAEVQRVLYVGTRERID